MVDGADVGASECFNFDYIYADASKNEKCGFSEHYQDFKNADMILVDGFGSYQQSSAGIDPATNKAINERHTRIFPVYAIYNNRVVKSQASEITISSYYGLWKEKMILATKKPYILSGVGLRKIFIKNGSN